MAERNKVYCKNCKHYVRIKSYWTTVWERCNAEAGYRDTYRGKEKIYLIPSEANRNNDCKYFEPKPKKIYIGELPFIREMTYRKRVLDITFHDDDRYIVSWGKRPNKTKLLDTIKNEINRKLEKSIQEE